MAKRELDRFQLIMCEDDLVRCVQCGALRRVEGREKEDIEPRHEKWCDAVEELREQIEALKKHA